MSVDLRSLQLPFLDDSKSLGAIPLSGACEQASSLSLDEFVVALAPEARGQENFDTLCMVELPRPENRQRTTLRRNSLGCYEQDGQAQGTLTGRRSAGRRHSLGAPLEDSREEDRGSQGPKQPREEQRRVGRSQIRKSLDQFASTFDCCPKIDNDGFLIVSSSEKATTFRQAIAQGRPSRPRRKPSERSSTKEHGNAILSQDFVSEQGRNCSDGVVDPENSNCSKIHDGSSVPGGFAVSREEASKKACRVRQNNRPCRRGSLSSGTQETADALRAVSSRHTRRRSGSPSGRRPARRGSGSFLKEETPVPNAHTHSLVESEAVASFQPKSSTGAVRARAGRSSSPFESNRPWRGQSLGGSEHCVRPCSRSPVRLFPDNYGESRRRSSTNHVSSSENRPVRRSKSNGSLQPSSGPARQLAGTNKSSRRSSTELLNLIYSLAPTCDTDSQAVNLPRERTDSLAASFHRARPTLENVRLSMDLSHNHSDEPNSKHVSVRSRSRRRQLGASMSARPLMQRDKHNLMPPEDIAQVNPRLCRRNSAAAA